MGDAKDQTGDAGGAITEAADGARIKVRLTPRASREQIVGVRGGAVHIRVTAPPADNRANQALCKLLARAVGVAKGRVSVVAGDKSRDKVVAIEGLDPTTIAERLALDQA